MVSPNDALNLLHSLGHTDVTLDDQNLLTGGKINSIDVMNLISEIEERYKNLIDVDLIEQQSFESCANIANLINKAYQ